MKSKNIWEFHEFYNIADSHRSCSFSALHDSQIPIESVPKEIYITSLLGQNIFASK